MFISELQVHTSLVSESFVALTPAVSRLHVERRVRPAEILYTPLSGWEPEKEGCVSRLSALPSEKKLPFYFHSFHFGVSFPSFNNFLVLFHFYLPIHIFFLSSIEMLHVFFSLSPASATWWPLSLVFAPHSEQSSLPLLHSFESSFPFYI